MPAVEAVIFDLGNVLIFHDNAVLYRRLGEVSGLSPEAVAAHISGPELFEPINRGTFDAGGIHRAVCSAIDVDLTFEAFSELWCCHFSPNPDVQPLVEALVGRVRLVLLSNTNVIHTAYLRPWVPVLDRFDGLLFSHDLGLVKPERAIFQRALAAAGSPPEQTAYFDDAPEFISAARELGIRGLLYRDVPGLAADLESLGLS